ncbi:MAG TPA: efflux RND transporter permease subunit, partial [Planctomycetota bacterium]|nr:efflux RND transporter permease subunit [Planctomycetota bacterium]
LFAVSTNIIAFLPLLFVPGETGLFFRALPAVVIAVFSVSLIECLFVLPAHLAHASSRDRTSWWTRLIDRQNAFRERFERAIDRLYSPVIEFVLRNRYLTVSVFVAFFGSVVAYVYAGHIDFAFRPTIQTDFVQAEIELPTGTPVARVREVAFQIEEAAKRTLEQIGAGRKVHVGLFTTVAEDASNEAEVSVILVPQSEREFSSEMFANAWREHVGEIPDLESLFFDYLIGPGGSAEINVQLAHPDVETLRHAATDLADALALYPGVEDIRKGFGRAMPQLDFEITPEGRSLGITARDLGAQIRHSFYGAEALRQPRGRDELRVMVKLPETDRRSMYALENLLIRAPNGGEIPLYQAAVIKETEAPIRIDRVDGGRVVNVTANVIPGVTNANRVLGKLARTELPEILAKYPRLRYSYEGEQREQREALETLSWGMVAALFLVYALAAALVRSYLQALIIFLTIPWSLAAAIVGHVLLGFGLSIFSIFGMIALCGMVVNGALVLSITRQERLEAGDSPREAIFYASTRRFRPIALTAVTTFLGLAPMIFETSMQALFLVPMAISLGVGTLASSVVVLIFIPALVAILDDVRERAQPRPRSVLAETKA